MSLADELLADLEEGGDGEDEQYLAKNDIIEEIEPVTEVMEVEVQKDDSIRDIAKLRDSDMMNNIMSEIERRMKEERKVDMVEPIEANPEYKLIVEANNLAVEIDNEIDIINKFTRDKYSKRFPELSSLVSGALNYVMTVKHLGNELNIANSTEALQSILTQATIMVVSVTASTTQGQVLTPKELHCVMEACDMALQLNNFKLDIYKFVESRMSFISPNLSVIVGPSVAAKMMGVAGGITNLSKMPSCNVLVLGAQKKVLSGFSTSTILPHTGFLYYSDLVQSCDPDLRRKAARLLAGKCVLAARVDCYQTGCSSKLGEEFLEEIEKKLDKWQEPPPVKTVKPLPTPIDTAKKKRGGKRVRKMKERYSMTELRKQQNRMNFAEIEEDAYQDDLGFSTGQIGKSKTGRIRAPQIDEKTKVKISKTLQSASIIELFFTSQKNLQKHQVYGGSTTVKRHVAGTASSVAFTPLQGLEIVNPQAAEKRTNEASGKYFSNTSQFLKVMKLKESKFKFAGHVLRGSNGKLINLILEGCIEGVRDKGRQRRRTWGDDVKEWTRTTTIEEAKRIAENRGMESTCCQPWERRQHGMMMIRTTIKTDINHNIYFQVLLG
ncbi:U4/U6 small nuclear ribonucleoprotein Prp31 [Nymphon striatum]|nr:U4/U6 small nuclear ribonucleoprotein Prp31 [Nymphon striatum]